MWSAGAAGSRWLAAVAASVAAAAAAAEAADARRRAEQNKKYDADSTGTASADPVTRSGPSLADVRVVLVAVLVLR